MADEYANVQNHKSVYTRELVVLAADCVSDSYTIISAFASFKYFSTHLGRTRRNITRHINGCVGSRMRKYVLLPTMTLS